MNQHDPKLDYCLPDSIPAVATMEARDPDTGNLRRRPLVARDTDPLRQAFTERLLLEMTDKAGSALETEETEWSLRRSYQQEMHHLFELCGFEVLHLYSDYAGAAPRYEGEQIWVCQKV